MMNFFRNLFKTKEEDVKVEELENWIVTHIKTEDVKEELQRIQNIREQLKQNLKKLEEVEIKDQVPQKAKDVVKGNIPAYIRAVEIFLEKTNIPEENNPEKIIDFYESTQKELDNLGKRTARNFAIMQTLIGKELADTAKNIKEIDEATKNLVKKAQKLKKIEEIKKHIKRIEEARKNKEEYERLVGEYKKEKERLAQEKKELEKEIKRLEEGKEAKELQQLKKQLEGVEHKKKELDNELLNLFSPLEKALKRYNNMFYIKKVEDYIESATETLKQDKELEIIKYFNDIKKMVVEGKMELKDDKKKKALESLERLNKDYLTRFIKEHEELDKERANIEQKIIENKYEKEKRELHNKIIEKDKRTEEIEKEMGKIKEENIKEHVKEIEKELKELGYEVRINAVD